jgi:hypothetical protein
MKRKFDDLSDQRIYEGFMAIRPKGNGHFREVIDEGKLNEEIIEGDSLNELLKGYLNNYEKNGMPELVLSLLRIPNKFI